MAHLVNLEYCDYRNVVKEHGTFDKVISSPAMLLSPPTLPALQPVSLSSTLSLTRCPSPPLASPSAGDLDRDARGRRPRDPRSHFSHPIFPLQVISIEMLEAVGHEHLPSFFQTVSAALKPGGVAAVQVITLPDERYEAYCT